MISPKGYWTNKVEELKNYIKLNEHRIQSLKIALEKEKALKKFQLLEVMAKARNMKVNQQALIDEVYTSHEQLIHNLEEQIEEINKHQKKNQVLLEEAYQHFKDLSQNP